MSFLETHQSEFFVEIFEKLVILLIDPAINLIVGWLATVLFDHGLRRLRCSRIRFTHLERSHQLVSRTCISVQPVTPAKKQHIAYSGCDSFYLGVTPESKNLLGEQQ